MKTDELIWAIAKDAPAPRPWLGGRMAAALLAGGAVSYVLFALTLGVRPDISWALQTWRFTLKVTILALSLAAACWASTRLAQPQTRLGDVGLVLAAAPAVLALAVGYELVTLPAAEWATRAVGTNSRVCLVSVPLLSLAPLLAMLGALRAGAPRSTATAGAVAGLLAGGLGAALYALHCIDDSPLFVAVWYPLAVAAVALLGAALGRLALRW